MFRVVLKFSVGIAVLLTSVGLWWSVENESTDQTNSGAPKVEWNSFPVVLADNAAEETSVGYGEATVVFVYSPYQCYSSRDAMNGWHRAARQVEGVQAVNVLQDRGLLPARRYLNTFSPPYQTRLDSTGWFRKNFDLSTTPAVVLISKNEGGRIVYPTSTSLSNEQRRQYVQQLVSPIDS